MIRRLRPGALIDSNDIDTGALVAAGAELWPATLAPIAAAALRCAALQTRQGIDEVAAERVMRSGIAAQLQIDESNVAALAAKQGWTAVSGAFVIGAGNFDVDVTSAPASSTMPAIPGPFEAHMFKANAAATNNLTLTAAAGQTIEQTDGTFGSAYVFATSSAVVGFFFEVPTSRWRIF